MATNALQKHHKRVTSTPRAQACPQFAQQEIFMLHCFGLAGTPG
jgi:hypothetical protein